MASEKPKSVTVVASHPRKETMGEFFQRAKDHPETLTKKDKAQMAKLQKSLATLGGELQHSEAVKELGRQVIELNKVASKSLAPMIKQMSSLMVDIKLPHFEFTNHMKELAEALQLPQIETTKKIVERMAELSKPVQLESWSVKHIANTARLNIRIPPPQVIIDPPPTEVAPVFNTRVLAKDIAQELWDIRETQAQPKQLPAPNQLIEFVAGHLRVLDVQMKFEGLRSTIIYFFYKQEDRSAWLGYADMQEVLDEHNTNQTAIREAIDDINNRVRKETENEISELIASRKTGNNHNSPKEYRWAH